MLIAPATVLIAAVATGWDLKTGRIPNYITFPAMLLGLILNTCYFGWHGLVTSLAGLGLGTLLLFVPFAIGGMGGGDVKLLAAVGALNGHLFTFRTFLYGAIAGGVLALLVAAVKGKLWQTLMNILFSFGNIMIGLMGIRKGKVNISKSEAESDNSEQTGPLSRSKGTTILTSGISFPYGVAILAGTIAAYCV